MTTDEEIENALLAIHSRLGTVEGKVSLVARANGDTLLPIFEAKVRKTPLTGQIYLLLDGKRTQEELKQELTKRGVETSQPTISRRLDEMMTEYGIADLVAAGGAGNAYRKNHAMEDTLNLSKRMEQWLEADGQVVPKELTRRRRRGRT